MKRLSLSILLILLSLSVISEVRGDVIATIPVIAQGNNDAHDYSFGPFTIPSTASFYRFVFDSRDQLIGAQTMTVVVKLSTTGGLNPQPLGGAVFTSLIQPADFAVPLPQVSSQGRVLEGRITIYGGRWKGAAYVEIE